MHNIAGNTTKRRSGGFLLKLARLVCLEYNARGTPRSGEDMAWHMLHYVLTQPIYFCFINNNVPAARRRE